MYKCDVCDSKNISIKYNRKPLVLQCKDCGYVFVQDENIRKLKEEVFYGSEDKNNVHLEYRKALGKVAENHLKVLNDYIPLKSKRVIDIGCSVGYFFEKVKQVGGVATGIDIDISHISVAKRRTGCQCYALPTKYYSKVLPGDIVTLWSIIEHLPRPNDMMIAIKKILKMNGLLVIDTPTEDALFRKLIHFANKLLTGKNIFVDSLYSKVAYGHTQCFSRKSITMLLQKHSFKVLKIIDSEYGWEYATKKPIFLSKTIKSKVLRFIARLFFIMNRFVGHKQHMTVIAKRLI